jgi:YVTN family beta-propeller protein
MNGGGEDDMADRRFKGEVAPMLEAWLDAVAPRRAPERMLEETFARTMVARQLPVYPWHVIGPVWRRAMAAHPIGRSLVAVVTVVVIVAVVAALLPRFDEGGVGRPSPSPSRASSTPSASASPSFPAAVSVAPSAVIPVEAGIGMTTDGTSIWLFTSTGKVVRVDPATNTLAATTDLRKPADAYQGLAVDANGLWVTDWDTSLVERLDPQTLRAVTTVAVGPQPKGVLVTSEAVWIANTRGGSVQRIDPATNKVVATINVGPAGPSGPNWLTAGFGSVWVGIPNNRLVVRINATTNAIEARIKAATASTPCGGLAAAPDAIWITSCDNGNRMARIDPATNTAVGTVDLGGNGHTVALIDGKPWVSPLGGQIVRVDPVRNVVDRVITPGDGFVGGGDVSVASGSLWVIDGGPNRVIRLPIASLGG